MKLLLATGHSNLTCTRSAAISDMAAFCTLRIKKLASDFVGYAALVTSIGGIVALVVNNYLGNKKLQQDSRTVESGALKNEAEAEKAKADAALASYQGYLQISDKYETVLEKLEEQGVKIGQMQGTISSQGDTISRLQADIRVITEAKTGAERRADLAEHDARQLRVENKTLAKCCSDLEIRLEKAMAGFKAAVAMFGASQMGIVDAATEAAYKESIATAEELDVELHRERNRRSVYDVDGG